MRDAFHVEGRVIEILPNGTVRAELGNGHQLVAFILARDKKKAASMQLGERLMLQLTPFDLSVGRIILKP